MNFRDVELLSAYLDGQLNSSDSAQLESRLKTDPELAAVMDDLRAARGLLRQLPSRRAPRNFTLTPKMVGLKPPLPRAYPVFRFASVFAALLFFLTYATNFVAPRLGAASAPASGYGMGGGGGPESAAATEAPAAPEPSLQMGIVPTQTPLAAEDGTRIMETPSAKSGTQESTNGTQPEASNEAPVFNAWQISFAVVAVVSALVAYLLRLSAFRKWRKRRE